MTVAAQGHVLVVAGDGDLRAAIADLLQPHVHVTREADAAGALRAVGERYPDLVICDLEGTSPDEALAWVRELRAGEAASPITVLVLGGPPEDEPVTLAGADDRLAKPLVLRDLVARVRLHVGHALERRRWKAELDRVTGEFDALMYSISHDLGAPLRAVDGFSRALSEDYGPTLDDEAREHIERISGGAKRMAGLIDDLLHLARMSRNPMAMEPIDLSATASQILSRLQRAEPARTVDAFVEEGLTSHGDKALLGKALTHLLENAWKFTSKTENARISFGREQGSEVPTFVVRDNGAGFQPDYAAKLFAPFRRLHSPNEFDGRGIGLASVKRIVSRHGGEVWAEGKVDEGAAFYFTLPE